MLASLAKHLGFPSGTALGLLRNPALAGAALKLLPPEARVVFTAMLTNTVSPTVLNAGKKTNVIPSLAEAQLDCRTLPGQTPEDAIAEILAVTGDKVSLEVMKGSTGAAFPIDTPLYRLMEAATQRMDPAGVVAPAMIPGATDATIYKETGMIVYGFTPGVMPDDFPTIKLGHGHDERHPISALHTGLPALWEVVSKFCCQ
jgi:acetylornithine deacetylase/succinyl-diaminopimelate desuccinylase-like protein